MRPARPLRFVAAALAAAVLAACGDAPGIGSDGDPQVAATVNGTDIPITELTERVTLAESNEEVAGQLAADTDGAARRQLESQALSELIQSALLEQGAVDLGVVIDDAAVTAQRAEVVEQVGGEEAFAEIIAQNGFSEEDVDVQLREIALQTAVQERLAEDVEVSDADIAAAYEEGRETRFGASRSARHILVEDEAAAAGIVERIRGGEDFAAIATAESIDTGSGAQGGDLGEVRPGDTVPEFDAAVFGAEVGELLGPIMTQFGFHIIEVTAINEPATLADATEELRAELVEAQTGDAIGAFLMERATAAEVEVNPRFGRWDPAAAAVVPSDPLGETVTEAPEGGAPPGLPGGGIPPGGGGVPPGGGGVPPGGGGVPPGATEVPAS